MIVIDTSALIAILKREADARRYMDAISAAEVCLLSSVSLLETSIVVAGSGGSSHHWPPLDRLIEDLAIEIVPHDLALTYASRDAFLRFGKGRHPAALNFGDCVSYALAKTRGLPLLFKGRDFAATDVTSALTE